MCVGVVKNNEGCSSGGACGYVRIGELFAHRRLQARHGGGYVAYPLQLIGGGAREKRRQQSDDERRVNWRRFVHSRSFYDVAVVVHNVVAPSSRWVSAMLEA